MESGQICIIGVIFLILSMKFVEMEHIFETDVMYLVNKTHKAYYVAGKFLSFSRTHEYYIKIVV